MFLKLRHNKQNNVIDDQTHHKTSSYVIDIIYN